MRGKKQLACWLWRETNTVMVYLGFLLLLLFIYLLCIYFKQDKYKKLPVGWISIVHKQLLS